MSIDTRFTPAIRNALLEKMHDLTGRHAMDTTNTLSDEEGYGGRGSADTVNISANALRTHTNTDTKAGQEVFNAERVAEVKQAIATGMYSIDPVRIAAKLYRFNVNL